MLHVFPVSHTQQIRLKSGRNVTKDICLVGDSEIKIFAKHSSAVSVSLADQRNS